MSEALQDWLQAVDLDEEVLTMIKENGLTPSTLAEVHEVLEQTAALFERWRSLGVLLKAEAKASAYVN